jgi:hypothetical protein
MKSTEIKLTAVEYDAGPYPLWGNYAIPDRIMQKDESLKRNRVYISHRGENAWVIYHNKEILCKDGHWDYEPFPSSRSKQFIEQTRFSTPEQAFAFWCEIRNEMVKNGQHRDRWECEIKVTHV